MSPQSIESIRNERLNGYKAVPRDIIEHYKAEDVVRRSYAGENKFLFELLQNAEDAMSEMGKSGKVKVYLSKEKIIIANEGKPFSFEGLNAICCQNISPKSKKGFIGNKGIGFKSVLNLTDSPSIFSGEFNVNWCREKTKTFLQQNMDQNIKNPFTSEGIPLMRLPFECQAKGLSLDFKKEGYSTIIELPLKEEIDLQNIIKQVENFDEKSLVFLLYVEEIVFCGLVDKKIELIRGLEKTIVEKKTKKEIYIKCNESEIIYDVFRQRIGEQELLSDDPNAQGFVEVALAFSQNKDTNSKIYNFFPTKEYSPYPFLIHGTFLLDEGRKYFREDNTSYHKVLYENLSSLFCEICIPNLVRERNWKILELLDSQKEFQEGSVSYEIQELFKDRIKETKFLPRLGSKSLSKPTEVKLQKLSLGKILETQEKPVSGGYILPEDWQEAENKYNVLELYGAKNLMDKEFFVLIENLIPKSLNKSMLILEKTIEIINEKYGKEKEKYLSLTKKLPIWWVHNSPKPISIEECGVILTKKPTVKLPIWLSVKVIESNFLKIIEESRNYEEQIKNFELYKEYIIRPTEKNILNKVLLPFLEKNEDPYLWYENGLDILKLTFYLMSKELLEKKHKHFIWDDRDRSRVAKAIQVPVEGGQWMPAWKVYASKSYGCIIDFENNFRDIADRGILDLPDIFSGKDEQHIHNFFEYIGVSFILKIIPTEHTGKKERYFCDLGNPFPDYVLSYEDWRKYIDYLWDENNYDHSPRYKDWQVVENYAIDGFPEIIDMKNLKSFLDYFFEIMSELSSWSMSYKGKWSYLNTASNLKYFSSEPMLIWQIKNVAWLNLKEKPLFFKEQELFFTRDVFIKEKLPSYMSKVFPIVDIAKLYKDANKAREMLIFCTKELCMKEELKNYSIDNWKNWLDSLSNIENQVPTEELLKISLFLYKEFISTQFDNSLEWPIKGIKLPALNYKKELVFVDKESIWMIDSQAYDIFRDYIQKDLEKNIFILELEKAENIKDRLEIDLVSENIIFELNSDYYTNKNETKEANSLIKNRKFAFDAIANDLGGGYKKKLNEFFSKYLSKIQVVNHLKVQLRFRNNVIFDDVTQDFYFHDTQFFVNGGKDWKENLSLGIGKFIGKMTDSRIKDVIKEETEESLKSKLRIYGLFITNDIEEEENLIISKENIETETIPSSPRYLEKIGRTEKQAARQFVNINNPEPDNDIHPDNQALSEDLNFLNQEPTTSEQKSPVESNKNNSNRKIITDPFIKEAGFLKKTNTEELSIDIAKILEPYISPSNLSHNGLKNNLLPKRTDGASNNKSKNELINSFNFVNSIVNESEEHKNLKNHIKNNPDLLTSSEILSVKEEHTLITKDRIDVFIETKDTIFIVEVKTASFTECFAGIFQLIKYKKIMETMQILLNKTKIVKSVLVSSRFPAQIKDYCSKLEIEPFEIDLSK